MIASRKDVTGDRLLLRPPCSIIRTRKPTMTLSAAQHKSKEQLDKEKRTVAEAAIRWVKSDMRLGLGSGSTAHHFIRVLGERVRSGSLQVEGIPTSRDSEILARESGIPLLEPQRGLVLDLDVDGADEIGPDLA